MWILTSDKDPRCRSFINSAMLTLIGHMSGASFSAAIAPDVIKGIGADDTVIFGQEAENPKPRFLLVFRDNEDNRKLAALQEAVKEALVTGAGVLDLEEIGQALLRQ